ncbi:PREDICTED: interleukin-2 receptor subunit alpha isoform X2 [Chinchilla lanigera]|uniref:interleukin-2 receptor subunit alpha isoform X2 n=1 Tax=Chinchilla lanigera TaxID=34839 RepID=UPI0006982C43|nr:PREDICTED: interleukin-2 receptor subunit alpha isoform X2 [Chinchilla lanigera]
MEPHLLTWGLFTFIVIPSCMTEDCDQDPPSISYATSKALSYKNGTMVNCECKKGFRRIKNGSVYLLCRGSSSWANRCQCVSTSPRNTREQVTPQPEEHKGKNATEMRSQIQPVDTGSLPGDCQEPPPWKHEAAKRIYHFKVGQTIHYQCIQGYKAIQRGPAISVCKVTCGETKWTWPQLTCIADSELHLFAGQEDSPASTEALPESETSCPHTRTESPKEVETATTVETPIFPREYHVAVAGCVFLLISILLLSGLTWQWRWF